MFWLYIIGAFTTVGLVSSANTVFAQGAGAGGTPFYDPTKAGGTNVAGAGTDQGEGIIDIVKRFINYALGFLALIALCMLLWGGYKMVASGGDEGAYKEGIKILKNAAIGIAFIAVSWFLVTFIFTAIGFVVGA
jgi:Type IV secretion system pilin